MKFLFLTLVFSLFKMIYTSTINKVQFYFVLSLPLSLIPSSYPPFHSFICTLIMLPLIHLFTKKTRSIDEEQDDSSISTNDSWHYCPHCQVGFSTETRHHWHLSLCKLIQKSNKKTHYEK